MLPIFKSKALIHQSKANLNEKVLFGKVPKHQKNVFFIFELESRIPCFILIYDLLSNKFNAIVSFRIGVFNFNSK